jgi:hypothetical protein
MHTAQHKRDKIRIQNPAFSDAVPGSSTKIFVNNQYLYSLVKFLFLYSGTTRISTHVRLSCTNIFYGTHSKLSQQYISTNTSQNLKLKVYTLPIHSSEQPVQNTKTYLMQDPPYTTKGMTTSRQWRRPPWRTNQPAPQPDSNRFQPSAEIPPPRPPNPTPTIPGATEKGTSNQAPFQTLGTGTDDSTLTQVPRTSHHTSIETTMARIRPCLTPP